MTGIYDRLLDAVRLDTALLEKIPAHKLRHQLAALLVVEASRGPIEVKRIEEAVITSLRVLAGSHIDALLATGQTR